MMGHLAEEENIILEVKEELQYSNMGHPRSTISFKSKLNALPFICCSVHPLGQWFSTERGDFPSQGAFGNVEKHFWLSQVVPTFLYIKRSGGCC